MSLGSYLGGTYRLRQPYYVPRYILEWSRARGGSYIPVVWAPSIARARAVAAHFEWSGWNRVTDTRTGAVVDGPERSGALPFRR